VKPGCCRPLVPSFSRKFQLAPRFRVGKPTIHLRSCRRRAAKGRAAVLVAGREKTARGRRDNFGSVWRAIGQEKNPGIDLTRECAGSEDHFKHPLKAVWKARPPARAFHLFPQGGNHFWGTQQGQGGDTEPNFFVLPSWAWSVGNFQNIAAPWKKTALEWAGIGGRNNRRAFRRSRTAKARGRKQTLQGFLQASMVAGRVPTLIAGNKHLKKRFKAYLEVNRRKSITLIFLNSSLKVVCW